MAAAAPPQLPSFGECLYRAMLRLAPDRRDEIQDALRLFKEHPGLRVEEVHARLVAALGKDFVKAAWLEARHQHLEAYRADIASTLCAPVTDTDNPQSLA